MIIWKVLSFYNQIISQRAPFKLTKIHWKHRVLKSVIALRYNTSLGNFMGLLNIYSTLDSKIAKNFSCGSKKMFEKKALAQVLSSYRQLAKTTLAEKSV